MPRNEKFDDKISSKICLFIIIILKYQFPKLFVLKNLFKKNFFFHNYYFFKFIFFILK